MTLKIAGSGYKMLTGCTGVSRLITPIGLLEVGASDSGIRFIRLMQDDSIPTLAENHHSANAARQLGQYFDGSRKEFDVEIDFSGHTEFSERVWHKLMEIPYGTTVSYAALATSLGDIKCIRAAASANGRNPIPVIVPCHRVIGSDGSLTGFALGLHVKKYLLTLENPDRWRASQLSFNF